MHQSIMLFCITRYCVTVNIWVRHSVLVYQIPLRRTPGVTIPTLALDMETRRVDIILRLWTCFPEPEFI